MGMFYKNIPNFRTIYFKKTQMLCMDVPKVPTLEGP
jgi:hypothetical protein